MGAQLMLPSCGSPRGRDYQSLYASWMRGIAWALQLGQGRAGSLHSAQLPPTPEIQDKWHTMFWPLPDGTELQGLPLSPPAQPTGAAPVQALPTISSSATPRNALMPWLTSVRSSADSGTCTSSTAMPSTTGCPTSTGMVSPQGQSRAGAQRQCPRLRTGCGYQQSPWGPSPRIFKHTVGMGARADRVPILEREAAVWRERLSEPLGSVPTSAWLCWEKLFLNPIAWGQSPQGRLANGVVVTCPLSLSVPGPGQSCEGQVFTKKSLRRASPLYGASLEQTWGASKPCSWASSPVPCQFPSSQGEMPPVLRVQGDWGGGVHEAHGARRDTLLLQGCLQPVCARGVQGECRGDGGTGVWGPQLRMSASWGYGAASWGLMQSVQTSAWNREGTISSLCQGPSDLSVSMGSRAA